MTEQSEHLSSAQIENYGNRSSVAGPESAQRDEHQRVDDQRLNDQNFVDQQPSNQRSDDPQPGDQRSNDQNLEDQRVEAHLADCPSCRNRLLDFHRAHFTLLVEPADPQLRTASTPDCPSDDDLRQLAAGLSPNDVATKLTQHAATCDHCGPLLKTYTEDFSDDFSPEEQAVLNNLQSSSASWQKNTAREMLEVGVVSAARAIGGESTAAAAPTTDGQSSPRKSPARPTVDRKPFFWKWILVPATAAVVALAAFSIWYTQRDTPEKVEKLLAQAYTEHRTIEMRWPGAEWGEVRTMRGQTSTNKSLKLLTAANDIQRQTPQTLKKTEWLHLRAQNEILTGVPSAQLVQELSEVIQTQRDAPFLKFDLALAYFKLGEVTQDPKHYLASKGVLDEILRISPSNSVALFNRAVVEQRLNLLDPAVTDFRECLKVESDPDWSNEARQRLERLLNLR